MSEHSYRRVMAAFMGKPWAILPEKLAQLAEILVLRVEGQRFSEEEIAERIAVESYAAKSKRKMQTGGGVAVIPVYGVITPRADMMTEMSGGTSMQSFIAAINQATNDPQVASILLDVDSPGGQVDMVPEAAAAIRAARSRKPVTAVANTTAASAAYWLASQASEFVISPSAEVGSIGVFAAHNDLSEAMAAQGVKTTLVSAGKYKTELSPYQPLTDEAKANVQETVDEYYSIFTKDVAAGRRVQVSAVRAGFGEGRMLTSGKAVAAGMADRVGTFEETLHRMISQASKGTVTSHGGFIEGASAVELLQEAADAEFPQITSGLGEAISTSSNNLIGMGNTTSSASNIHITYSVNQPDENLWPPEEPVTEEAALSADSEEIGAESDLPDATEPQESFADMRIRTRNAAMDEREQYLSLLRRITK